MRTRLVLSLLLVPAIGLAAPDPKKPADKDKKEAPKPADKAEGDKDKKEPPKDPPKDPPKEQPTSGDQPPPPKDTKDDVDVDTLRQEYLSLRDELFKSRARANTVASQLYSTRIQIKLTYTSARYYNPAKATVRLDGASVYENTTGAIGGDDGVRFDGYVAPGRHLVTFRVEATGKDDDTFTSVTETQVVVKAVAGKDLIVAAKAKDSGDIAYEWKKKEKGSYGLGIDVAVKTTARAGGDADVKAAPPPPKATEKKK